VRSLVNAGATLVSEVALDSTSWSGRHGMPPAAANGNSSSEFKEFVRGWQKFRLVMDEYKIVLADLQTFFTELRLWLERIELSIERVPQDNCKEHVNEIAHSLRGPVTLALNNIFERFEACAGRIADELQPTHRAFGQRVLHPQMLCAPFIHRTYAKPLGYAGDYEMMNMILRNEFEGTSLFARLIHAYMLDQAPAHAVRNRVGYLSGRIVEETARVARLNRTARIFDVACGPARAVENFIIEHPLSDRAHIRLLDFNEETLKYTSGRLDEARRRHCRATRVELVRNSVHSLLKAQSQAFPDEQRYDLIYSSGLYDYLGDRVCKALNSYLYRQLAPGGLLVIGNFNTCNPIRWQMEHVLEWYLIYRDSRQVAQLAPEEAPPENVSVRSESTGTNIFLEVRKPE
jgi:extracellular factor (EF) 3-hydroxypalmitic acid methyl ester biosynthesis protein